jgi:hypothetical protein
MYLTNIKRIRMEYTGNFKLTEKIRDKLIEDGWHCVTSWHPAGKQATSIRGGHVAASGRVAPAGMTWTDDIRREPIIGRISHGVPIGVYR